MPRIVLSLPGTGEVAQPTTERRLFSCRSRANNNSRAPGSSNPGSERRLASRRASPPSDTAGASAPGQSSNSTPSGQHSMSFQGSRGKQQSTPEPTAGERSVTAALAHSDAPMAVVPSSGTPTAASQLGQTLSAHDGPAYASYPAQAGASQSLPLQLGMGPAFVSADLSALLSPDPPEEVLGPSGQVYRSTSLGCLRPHQQPRRFAIFVVESKWFDPVVLATIGANCATLAWQSPLDPSGTAKEAFIAACDWLYLAIFTVELLLKVLAYGFLMHEGSYLRDAWCQMDFAVVTLAWLPVLFPSLDNYSAFRTIRALRPLRALKRVPGMPVLVKSIIDAMPRLFTVVALCGCVLFVFGIVGVEAFKGSLHHHCSETENPALEHDANLYMLDIQDLCNPDSPSDVCANGMQCRFYESLPRSGTMSFDNIGGAMIGLMQTVTFDGYEQLMGALMLSYSSSSYIFFVLAIVLLGFFIINLFLAVLFDEFTRAKNADAQVTAAMTRAVEGASTPRASETAGSEGKYQHADAGEAQALLPAGAHRSDGSASKGPAADLAPSAALSRTDASHAADERNANVLASASPSPWLGRLVTEPWFGNAATMLVLANMAVMCMPYQGMPAAYEAQLENVATAISLTFVLEMALKLLGLGCVGYWSDNWNVLDGSIVTVTVFEMLVSVLATSAGMNLSFLRMLRMLRLLRVLRLMKSWTGLYRIVVTFIKALPQLSNMFVLIALVLMIFSLVGMQLFGGHYDEAHGYSVAPCPVGVCADAALQPLPRYHFNYFVPSLLTSFVLLTGSWSSAMEPAVRATGWSSSLFFVFAVLIGVYLIMNLFVAILLNTFSEDMSENKGTSAQTEEFKGFQLESAQLEAESLSPASGDGGAGHDGFPMTDVSTASFTRRIQSPSKQPSHEGDFDSHTWRDSFLCIGPNSRIRRWCIDCVHSKVFDNFIIVVIMVSSLTLALDTPRLDRTSNVAAFLQVCDFAFLVIFSFEMFVKVVSYGFVVGKDPYIKSGWNILDFFIVLVSYIAFLAQLFPQLAKLRSLRILRVLRPLRLVARNAGMRLIIRSLLAALPDVSNVLGVVLTFQVVFAILGLQLFMGMLATCTDPALTTQSECVPATDIPGSADQVPHRMLRGGSTGSADADRIAWENPRDIPGSFDSFGDVMLLLYVMSTGDGWDTVMYRTMDSTGVGSAPVRNDFSSASIYSIAWIFIGSFFAMNLFVGVIVDNFNRIKRNLEKQDAGGTATMTSEQQEWSKTMIASVSNSSMGKKQQVSHTPANVLRAKVYTLVRAPLFEGMIFTVIIANVLLMACDYYGIEEDRQIYGLYNGLTNAFVHIYYVECILKVIGMGKQYFFDTWCQLDFFLVVTAAIDEFGSGLLASIGGTGQLRILRVLRVLRILRLLKGAKELKKLIITLMLCIAPLFNIAALLMLTVFIYSVLGVHLFTFTRHTGSLSDTDNFDSLSSASLLLFQCLTGNGWGTLMTSASITQDSGLCTEEDGNCGSSIAIPFFVSFQILGSFIFLNLVVAVMIESFTELGKEPDHTDEIVDVWQKLTLDSRVDAYVKALKASGHPDAKLADIASVAREKLRDEYAWDVVRALDAAGISVASRAPHLLNNPDFDSNIWTIRTVLLKDLLLSVPPPIGLKGLVASYSDAAKLLFKLHFRQVNGRVALKDALAALLKAKLTGEDSGHVDIQANNSDTAGSADADTGRALALEAIRIRLRERKERQALSLADRMANSLSRRRRTIVKKRADDGIPEYAWDRVKTGIFFPVAPTKKTWDAIVMALILYSVVMVPYRVCFDAGAEGRMLVFEIAVSLTFCMDLVLTFNTAFLEGDRWIIDRMAIAVNYVNGWFIIDLLASIPVELIVMVSDSEGADELGMSQLRILRGLRMVRLLRLLKLLKLDEYIAQLETELKVNLKVLKIARMVASLLFLMHLLGCFWFYLALIGGYETTWISEYDEGSGLSASNEVKYIYSVYWALTTLTTVGYGDITPANDLERLYTLFSLLVGALVFGYMLSSVGSMMANLSNRSNLIDSRLDQLQEVIRHTDLPADLASRLRSYTEYYFTKQSVFDIDETLSHLTPSLEVEVKEAFVAKTVDTLPLLRVFGHDFKLELMAKLKPVMYEASEKMIPKGDRTSMMYFLIKGEVRAASGELDELFHFEEPGRYFGENALLKRSCPVTYVATTRCELFVISCKALATLVRAHLNEHERARLSNEIVIEWCRKVQLRHFALRLYLGALMDDTRSTSRNRRLRAALTLQVVLIHQHALPSSFADVNLDELMWSDGTAGTPSAEEQATRRSANEGEMAADSWPASTTASDARDDVKRQVQDVDRKVTDMDSKVSELNSRMASITTMLKEQAETAARAKQEALEENRAMNARLTQIAEHVRVIAERAPYSA